MAYPVLSVRMPADLVREVNGRLSPAVLAPITFSSGGTGHHLMVRALKAMHAAAASEGVDLTWHDPYRPYAEQWRIFFDRYTTTYRPGAERKVFQGVVYYKKYGKASAATPGDSNHGLGIAIDFKQAGNRYTKVVRWLLSKSHLYGFSWEIQSEPWHLRYVSGDFLPGAVVRFEATNGTPQVPMPPQSGQEEDEMAALKGMYNALGDDAIFFVYSDGTKKWIPHGSYEEAQQLCFWAGVPTNPSTVENVEMFRALGPVTGPLPNDVPRDPWGAKV